MANVLKIKNEKGVFIDIPAIQGPPGPSPKGGTTGQVLTKASDQDGDLIWSDAADPNAIIGDGSIKSIVELSWEDYKQLEHDNLLKEDTEYHIDGSVYGELTGLTEGAIRNIIDTTLDEKLEGGFGGGTVAIEDSLTSDSTVKALSAAQGKLLNEKFNDYALTSSLHSYMPLSGGTFTGPVNIGQGDGAAVQLGTDGRININNTSHTALGLLDGNVTLGHSDYPLKLRGSAWAPTYEGRALLQVNDIVNNLESASTTSPLSANMGYYLQNHKKDWHYVTIDLRDYNANTWYPVIGNLPTTGMTYCKIAVHLNSGTKPAWSTHSAGFTCNLEVLAIAGGWGTTGAETIVLVDEYRFADAKPVSFWQATNSSRAVFMCRGGGRYFIMSDGISSWDVLSSTYEYGGQSIAPTTSAPTTSVNHAMVRCNLNAGYAYKQGVTMPAAFVQSNTPTAMQTGDIWFIP